MKKALFCVLFVVLALPLFAGPSGSSGMSTTLNNGVSARLQSMGSPEFIIEDPSSEINLYEAGFGAAIFGTKKKNTLSLSPGLELDLFKVRPESDSNSTMEATMFGAGNGLSGLGNKDGLMIYPADDLAVSIRPFGEYLDGSFRNFREDGLGGEQKGEPREYLYGGNVEVSKKFSPGFAMSGLLGYTSHMVLFRDKGDIHYRESGNFTPIAEISAAFLSESRGGWNLGITAGNKAGTDPLLKLKGELTQSNLEYEIMGFASGIFTDTFYYEDSKTTTEDVYYQYGALIHINFGAAREGENDAFSANIGLRTLVPYKEYYERIIYDNSGKETAREKGVTGAVVDSGIGALANMAYRINLGAFTTGAKIDFSSMYIKEPGNSSYNVYSVTGKTGATYTGIEGVKIPLEIYLQDITAYDMKNDPYFVMSTGASLGSEITLSKGFDIRFGANAGINGEGNGQDKMICTVDNRGIFVYGVSAGVGIKNDSITTNIGVKWDSSSQQPRDNFYKQAGAGAIKIVSDITINL